MNRLRNAGDRGAVAYVAIGAMLVGLVMLAFVIDRGYVYFLRAKLQAGVDATVLAAGQELCVATGGNPKGVAESYAAANGIVASKILIAAPTKTPPKPASLSIFSTTTFTPFFGVVTGVNEYQIAAMATANRSCTKSFKVFADHNLTVTGSGNNGGNFFAGNCFYASQGGTFSLIATRNPQVIAKGICGGSVTDPIDTAVTVPNESANKKYSQTLTLSDVLDGIDVLGMINDVKGNAQGMTGSNLCSAVTAAQWAGGNVWCSGAANVPTSFQYSLVTDGTINIGSNSTICSVLSDCKSTAGQTQLIFTTSGAGVTAAGDAIGVGANSSIGAKTYLIAPNGSVSATGQGIALEGYLVAYDTKFSGGNLGAGSGMALPFPGPVSLTE